MNLLAYLCHRVGLHFAGDDAERAAAFADLVARTRSYHDAHAAREAATGDDRPAHNHATEGSDPK